MTPLPKSFADITCCAQCLVSNMAATCKLVLLFPLTQKLAQLQAVVMLLLPDHTSQSIKTASCTTLCACMSAGHDRTGTTVWLALTLWTTMALGEAALLSQSSMSLAIWCAIFGLPSLYLQCRHVLDVLVEEALQLVAAFLRAGSLLHKFAPFA